MHAPLHPAGAAAGADPADGALSPRLAALAAPDSALVDTLRALRSQLLLRWFGQGRRALAVIDTGAPADSITAANLALVFAQLGQRTLLVDANVRHGVQHALFGLRGQPGLADMLAGRSGHEAIRAVAGVADLSVLGAGTALANAPTLLERPEGAALHEQLAGRFDVVLYDVAAGAQALAVAGRAGGALLLAHRDRTPLALLEQLVRQLGQAGVAVIGSVLVEH